jgi:hypothetical protein
MRRAARYPFSVLSALSLLLCVAVCVLWVRGCRGRGDYLGLQFDADESGRTVTYELHSFRGSVILSRAAHDPGPAPAGSPPGPPGVRWVRFGQPLGYPAESVVPLEQFAGGVRHVAGLGVQAIDVAGPVYPSGRERWRVRGVVVGHWFVALLAAALPSYAAARGARDARRSRLGLCPACGYDLRATPRRCPECGAGTGEGAAAGQAGA